MRRTVAVLTLVAALPALLAAGGCGEGNREQAPSTTEQSSPPAAAPPSAPHLSPAAAPFRQAATLRCLRAAGVRVSPLRGSTVPGAPPLSDIAQRASFELLLDGAKADIAFAKNVAGASLLVEILAVPDRAYAVVKRGNVVLLYRGARNPAMREALRCTAGRVRGSTS